MAVIGELIDTLAERARSAGGFSFTQTLLRVGGISVDDNFELFRSSQSSNPSAENGTGAWTEEDDFFCFLWNLMECAVGGTYRAYVLTRLSPKRSPFDNPRKLTFGKLLIVSEKAISCNCAEIADYLKVALAQTASQDSDHSTSSDVYESQRVHLRPLYQALLSMSDRERKAFGTKNLLAKWPQFETLELLINDSVGLYGYRIHFSNDTHAEFSRGIDGTVARNISMQKDGVINYNVGMHDELKREWRIAGKPLFEVGLPGRYNDLGCWKPIEYPGTTDWIMEAVRTLSQDYEIQGALFYVYTTAHWAVEFVVCATVDLPMENHLSFGPAEHPLRIWKLRESGDPERSERLYDGWVTLAEPTLKAVEQALVLIRIGMNRLAFTFDCELRWRLKYPLNLAAEGVGTPDKSDLARFDDVLVNNVTAGLDLAMSWYNAGKNAADPLTSFLSYFNAIEAVVTGAHEDGLVVDGRSISKPTKTARKQARIECIQAAYLTFMPDKPSEFAREVYFNCELSLNKRRRDVVELVMGPAHPVLSELFERNQEPSLTDIRNLIAHGNATILSASDVTMVKRRLGRLASAAKELILRVHLKKSPNETVDLWSGKFMIAMEMNDPRATMCVSSSSMLPDTDWRIRAEWLTF